MMAKKGHEFTLDYWEDGVWVVGRLREHPGVISQGKNLDELLANITDAFHELNASRQTWKAQVPVRKFKTTQVEIAV
jgi:predicted RNase H-like HicB family nuclease